MAGTLVTSNILQTAVAMGMKTLRENCVLSRLVNRDYEEEIRGQKVGNVVKVAVPASITTRQVTSNVVFPAVTAVTPTSVSVTVDQWDEAPFAMEDKALVQVLGGIIPMQLAEGAKALANKIDTFLWARITSSAGVYGYTGVAGTTPFGVGLDEFYAARKIAEEQLMPPDDRTMIVDPAAEANVLNLRVMQDGSIRGDGGDSFRKGLMGHVGGVDWVQSQNVPQHSSSNSPTGWLINDAGVGVGDETLIIQTGSGDPAAGDIFVIAGHDQTYMVESYTSLTITMRPNIQFAYANSAVLTFKGDYRVNLLYHRDCVAFAMAPLQEAAQTAQRAALTATAIDENSGLALRLEVNDLYKMTQWSFDALYGATVVRPELAVILGG